MQLRTIKTGWGQRTWVTDRVLSPAALSLMLLCAMRVPSWIGADGFFGSVAHAAEIPVVSYSYIPDTHNGTAGDPWMRDYPFGQLTDGIYLDASDPEYQYTSAKNVAWGMANGTGPTLYFDFGQAMSLGACTLHYRIDTIWGIVPPRQLTFSFSSENTPNTSDPENNTGWSGTLVKTVPDETGHLRSQYMADISAAGSARWVRLKLLCDSYAGYNPWTVLYEIDFDTGLLVINSQPQDVLAREGGTASFSITAQGSEPLSYQWQKDGADLVDDARVSGATTDTLTIYPVEAQDASDNYVCVVVDGPNPEGVPSEPASLSILVASAYGQRVLATDPVVYWNFDEADGLAWDMVSLNPARSLASNNPTRQGHGDLGNAAVFSDTLDQVFGTGYLGAGSLTGPFAFEFYVNTASDAGWAYMMEAGNHSPALLSNFIEADSVSYYTSANNDPIDSGETISLAPQTWYHLVYVNYDDGTMDAFLNGTRLEGFALSLNAGQSAGALYLDLSAQFHLGHHSFGVSGESFNGMLDEWAAYDLSGKTETQIAAITQAIASHSVQDGPVYVALDPRDICVPLGTAATFKCVAAGAEPITYQWKKNGLVLNNGAGIFGADEATLTLTDIEPADVGLYSCAVGNSGGSAESAQASLSQAQITVSPLQQDITICRETPAGIERLMYLVIDNPSTELTLTQLSLHYQIDDATLIREIFDVAPGQIWDTIWVPDSLAGPIPATLVRADDLTLWVGDLDVTDTGTQRTVVPQSPTVTEDELEPLSLRGTNYLPRYYPWPGIWREATEATFESEFRELDRLYINTFRTFYFSDHEGGLTMADGSFTPLLLSRINTLLKVADRHHIKVQMCVFSGGDFSPLDDFAFWNRYFRTSIEPFAYDGRMLVWDLVNEPGHSQGLYSEPLMTWLQTMYARLEDLAPNHMLTVNLCWEFDELWNLGIIPDMGCYHDYTFWPGVVPPGEPEQPNIYDHLRSIQENYTQDRPLIIGEFGINTAPPPATLERQLDIYTWIFEGAEAAAITGVYNWTAFHFVPDWMGPSEQSLGVISPDTSLKPAGVHMRDTYQRWRRNSRAPWDEGL